jgi:hypothetical protein
MSALWSLQQALYDALRLDNGYAALADGPFDGLAPRNYKIPAGKIGYVTMPESSEQDMRVFARKGYTGTETLNLFARTREDVKQIYAEVERILNGPRLALPGGTHIMLRGETRLIACTIDADGVSGRGVVQYDVITQAAA